MFAFKDYLDGSRRIIKGGVELKAVVDNFVRKRRSIKHLMIHVETYEKNTCEATCE
jgi:hypothetical protein